MALLCMLPGVLCCLLYGVAVVLPGVLCCLLYGVAVHVAWCTMLSPVAMALPGVLCCSSMVLLCMLPGVLYWLLLLCMLPGVLYCLLLLWCCLVYYAVPMSRTAIGTT